MRGVDLIPGPNATLEGSPEEIAKFITNKYELKFKSSDDKSVFQAEIKKNHKIIIQKHPYMINTSIVIGAYLGP